MTSDAARAEQAAVDAGALVTVRFWAGARRAAGHAEETLTAAHIAGLRDQLASRPALRDVVAVASFLVDATPSSDTTTLHAGAVVDVLPPFAGGSAFAGR